MSRPSPPSRGLTVADDPPDLALVDYRLPDGSGDEFVIWAADRFPVILLTAFGNERTAVEAMSRAGALDYVIINLAGNVRGRHPSRGARCCATGKMCTNASRPSRD